MVRLNKDDKAKKSAFAAKFKRLSEKIESLVSEYNDTVNAANAFIQEIHEKQDDYYSERSEKWQESDKGSDYESWMSEWEEEIEEIESPDMYFELIEDLPESSN